MKNILEQICSLFELGKLNQNAYKIVESELSQQDRETLDVATAIVERAFERYIGLLQHAREQAYIRTCVDKVMKSQLEYVYVVHIESDFYKIGRSFSPESRVRQFGCVNSDIVHKIISHDSAWAERFVQDKFKGKNVYWENVPSSIRYRFDHGGMGELYKLDADDIAYLKSLQFLENSWYEIGKEHLCSDQSKIFS